MVSSVRKGACQIGAVMKGGKHKPVPPAEAPILEVLGLLALLGWKAEDAESK